MALLLLFDIDGTLLLQATREHREALHDGLREVYGVPDPERAHVQAAGRTDPEIARTILLALGVHARRISELLPELRRAATEAFIRRCPPDLSARVSPGMLDLLERVQARPDIRLSLVTGNLEPIARLKLRRAGLERFFADGQGAFGSDHEDRTELPAIARARAGRPGAPWPCARTVVIGDTPLDVLCARADGCRCIAVATGPHRPDELQAADAVVTSPGELERAVLAMAPTTSAGHDR